MAENKQKFYLTTPIYYVNARPHIGHAYTTIVADVLARRHRLLGEDVFLLTGTDEHGQKIERSAAAANIPPQQFVDQVAASFEALWQRMGITYNKFIRTTSPEHKRGVQKLWRELESRGFIELRSYIGTYCVSDEAFVDAPAGTPCPECGRILETITEENYFFKLSQFQGKLLDLIESCELAIEPETRRNEVLSFLRGNVAAVATEIYDREVQAGAETLLSRSGGVDPLKIAEQEGRLKKSKMGNNYVPDALKDLSISRTSFKWGIPVPGNDKHVIYVWLDALANYMTAIGYGNDDPKEVAHFNYYWPADLHLVGKEIIRFHCVYWPAFLLAAELPLPKKVQAHGWLLFEESKMSKSRGNIVRTETILDAFGNEVYGKQFPDSTQAERDLFASDVLRYFLLREIPFGQDGSFSFDALITRYNADLANGYGNLVSRTLAMVQSYFDGNIPNHPHKDSEPSGLPLHVLFEGYATNDKFSDLLKQVWSIIGVIDEKITSEAPWKLAKSDSPQDKEKLAISLYEACASIRVLTAYLYPYIPYTAAKVWLQLGLGDIDLALQRGELVKPVWADLKPGTKLGPLAPIFPRAEKGLAQIMTDMESNNAAATPGAPTTPGAPSSAPAGASQTETKVGSAKSPTITIDDFAKIDLRAAVILVAERIPKADKLLRLEVDLGNGEKRQILSGIAEHYAPEDLIGRRIVIIANLAPRKMRGLESHGMLLAASEGENGKPILATFAEDIAPGSRLK